MYSEKNKNILNLLSAWGMFLIRSYNLGQSQPQRSYKKGSYKKKKRVYFIFPCGTPDGTEPNSEKQPSVNLILLWLYL